MWEGHVANESKKFGNKSKSSLKGTQNQSTPEYNLHGSKKFHLNAQLRNQKNTRTHTKQTQNADEKTGENVKYAMIVDHKQ